MCKFAKGDLVKFTPDAFCCKVDGKVFQVDLHGVIGRIDGATAKGFVVYFRVNGRDYKYEFPSFALIGVTDNVANRSHVASQTSVELNKEGLFTKFDDGTMYDFKGERYRPGVQGVTEETSQFVIDNINTIRTKCFNVGDKVRFTGGTHTLICYNKAIVYELDGRTGVIKSYESLNMYRVEVDLDGYKCQVFVPESDLTLQRIDTPLQDKILKILKRCPYFTILDGRFNYGKSWLMDLDCYTSKMDLSHFHSKTPESKMTKERCIKLLESYRAEREKVAKGRKFERRLRDEVVNEALEKAIELLKNG